MSIKSWSKATKENSMTTKQKTTLMRSSIAMSSVTQRTNLGKSLSLKLRLDAVLMVLGPKKLTAVVNHSITTNLLSETKDNLTSFASLTCSRL